MYTKELLIRNNPCYHSQHYITQSDVDIANEYMELIQSTRNDKKPTIGDMFQYTNEDGEFYGRAHYESESENDNRICWGGSHSHVYKTEQNEIGIGFLSSGGPWGSLDISKLHYVGKTVRSFWTWGSCGACGNGGLSFDAEVNLWRYDEPKQRYPGFSTEHWKRSFIYYSEKLDKNAGEHYHYTSFIDCIAFKTTPDYEAWKKTYCGVEFPGGSENQKVLQP